MICPKCGNKIDELDETCPFCKTNLDEYEEEQEEISNDSKGEDKTIFLRVINTLQIIACVIIAIILFANDEIGNGVIMLIIGFITFAFIKGFKDIIGLLDEINQKLK